MLDLSNRSLKKLPKVEGSKKVKVLLLDENELQKIDNLDNYLAIEKVCSAFPMKWPLSIFKYVYV